MKPVQFIGDSRVGVWERQHYQEAQANALAKLTLQKKEIEEQHQQSMRMATIRHDMHKRDIEAKRDKALQPLEKIERLIGNPQTYLRSLHIKALELKEKAVGLTKSEHDKLAELRNLEKQRSFSKQQYREKREEYAPAMKHSAWLFDDKSAQSSFRKQDVRFEKQREFESAVAKATAI